MKILPAVIAAILSACPHDQNLADCILALTGASCMEELDESEIERFEALSEHPAELNIDSRNKLLSSGLFSPYQVASLIDYRGRTGDILSVNELSLVDGFTPISAKALEPFVSFESSGPPGAARSKRIAQDLQVKAGVKRKDDEESMTSYGMKYHAEVPGRVGFNWSGRQTYDDDGPDTGNINLTLSSRKMDGRVIIGDYNARFGQGLVCWSGFSMSGYSSPTAFKKNASGLSPATSFTPMNRGVAAECASGLWRISGAVHAKNGDIGGVANLTRIGRTATIGLTATETAASVDWTMGRRNLSIFGEAACSYKLSPALISGLLWTPEYGRKYAVLGRYNVSGESGLALGVQTGWLQFSTDAFIKPEKDIRQSKSILTASREWEWRGISVKPSLRISERLKDAKGDRSARSDLRADLAMKWKGLEASGRFNWLKCSGTSWLCYTEAGYRNESGCYSYFRWTLFKIDKWDDRIYVYERDAPGSFNVPAYYGRGWAASAVAGLKFSRHSFYARIAYTGYPWTLPSKPSVFECRLQYRLKL